MNVTYPTCPDTGTPCAVCPCVECVKYRPEPGEVAAVLEGLFPGCGRERSERARTVPEPVNDSGPVWCHAAGPWEWSEDAHDWARTLDARFGPFSVGQVQTWDGRSVVFSAPELVFMWAEFVPADEVDLVADFDTIREDLDRAEQAMRDALLVVADRIGSDA